SSPTSAVLDAPARPGPHPLVVLNSGGTYGAMANNELAETLAAVGFVVVLSPEPPRPGIDDLTVINQLYEAQLYNTIQFARLLPEVDPNRIGVVDNWGLPALMLRAREPLLRAIAFGDEPPFPAALSDSVLSRGFSASVFILHMPIEGAENEQTVQKF